MYSLLIAYVCLSAAADPKPKAVAPEASDSAADEVKLRTGKVVLGEVIEKTKSGEVIVIVCRAWADKNIPALAKRWKDDEGAANKKAMDIYRARLQGWKRDRAALNSRDDRVSGWIDGEIARIDKRADGPTALLIVRLKPSDIRSTTRRVKEATRMLRLAWKCQFDNPEEMKVASLKESLAFRGLDPLKDEPVKLDDMLPVFSETDDRWLMRRAATEVAYDSGSCFREFGNTLVVDPFGGNAQSFSFSTMPNMNMPRPSVDEQLRMHVPRGRVGAAVIRQSNNANMDASGVEITLWARSADGRWHAVASSSSIIKAALLKPEDVQAAGANGPGAMTFSFGQSFQGGFGGPIESRSVQSHPNLAAASAKANAQAPQDFLSKLGALKLSVE